MLAHRVDEVPFQVEQEDIRVCAFLAELAEPGMKLLVNFAVLASVLGKVELFFFCPRKGRCRWNMLSEAFASVLRRAWPRLRKIACLIVLSNCWILDSAVT